MPKKKGGKKGAKIIDGLATNEMSREQLMGHVKRIQMELEREREERNFFMLEREKLFSLWNMTLEQISVEKDRTRLMEVQVADIEQEKQDEMNVFKQKLRFLMMEQAKKLAAARLNNLERMKRLQEETRSINHAMSESLEGSKAELKTAKRSMHELMQRLLTEHKLEVTKIRAESGDEVRRLEAEFFRRFFQWQEDAKTDDRLNSLDLAQREQIEEILDLHENQLQEMKKTYNDMMTNNFAIIATLQNDLEESRANEEKLRMEIKKLKETIEKLIKQKKAVESEDTKRVKDEKEKSERLKPWNTEALKNMEKLIEGKNKYCDKLECINEALLERAMLAEKERDELRQVFSKAILEMQKKNSMVKLVSDLKINSLLGQRKDNNRRNSVVQGGNGFSGGGAISNPVFLSPPAFPPSQNAHSGPGGGDGSSTDSSRTVAV